MIGCLVSPQVGVFTNLFFRDVFAGIEQVVLASDWSFLIDSVDKRCASPHAVSNAAVPMRLATDGYIVLASSKDTDLAALEPKPIVLVECEAAGEYARVCVDNARAGDTFALRPGEKVLVLGDSLSVDGRYLTIARERIGRRRSAFRRAPRTSPGETTSTPTSKASP